MVPVVRFPVVVETMLSVVETVVETPTGPVLSVNIPAELLYETRPRVVVPSADDVVTPPPADDVNPVVVRVKPEWTCWIVILVVDAVNPKAFTELVVAPRCISLDSYWFSVLARLVVMLSAADSVPSGEAEDDDENVLPE